MKRKFNNRKEEIWVNATEEICKLTGQKFELKRETLADLMEKRYCLVIDKKSEYFGKIGVIDGNYEFRDYRLWHHVYFKSKRKPALLNDKQIYESYNLPDLLEERQKLYEGEQQEFNFQQ